ncbi:SCO6880 family protein [Corynebacterium oculi]|uniref:ESX-1 secretion system protein EccE1 n=1 Tax=Corynebacterium oculi TaxID=1544416 RepID=A0A0Q0Z3Y5_9CORY|nr:SCO6880 family protein [Corynebacterium oculi]KQB84073.1 hypothetical protein Cocul_00869 [Corynebacterium oculi]
MVEIPNYSLGQPPKRTGLGGFSMKATAIVGGGFMVFLILRLVGLSKIGLFVVLPVSVVAAAVVSMSWGGRTLAQHVQMRWQYHRKVKRGEHEYVSGGLSRMPGGQHRLPGLLARTEIIAASDGAGRDFAIIVDRLRREATVVFDCQLSGQTAMMQEERNAMTASWGRWIAGLSLSGDVLAASVSVGVRPGSGELVRREVDSIMDENAPWLARRVMEDAAELLSVGVPEIDAHVAVTVKLDGEGLKEDAFVSNLATRVPTWAEDLSWAGILASPMDEQALVARVHQGFNPAAETEFERLKVAGQSHGLSWDDAGPGWARDEKDRYAHEGVYSVTWEMAEAPRSTFEDHVLTSITAPHSRVLRKRVTLLYRPFHAGEGAKKVEAEHRDALTALNSSKKIRSAAAGMRVEHTNAARIAQARGAQLGRYSLLVTATVDEVAEIPRMVHDVEQLGSGSSLRLQVATLQQDAAFICGLGVGQLPWTRESVSGLARA